MGVTGLEVELRPMNRSCRHPITLLEEHIIVEGLEPHQEAKGMLPWERVSPRYPAPLFVSVLSRPSSHITSINPLLPFIMVRPIMSNI